jgi:hypothetical protein
MPNENGRTEAPRKTEALSLCPNFREIHTDSRGGAACYDHWGWTGAIRTPENAPSRHLGEYRLRLAAFVAVGAAARVPSLDDEVVGRVSDADDNELGDVRAEEVKGVR